MEWGGGDTRIRIQSLLCGYNRARAHHAPAVGHGSIVPFRGWEPLPPTRSPPPRPALPLPAAASIVAASALSAGVRQLRDSRDEAVQQKRRLLAKMAESRWVVCWGAKADPSQPQEVCMWFWAPM